MDLTKKISEIGQQSYDRLTPTERAILNGARESALLNLLDNVLGMVANQRVIIAGHLAEMLPAPPQPQALPSANVYDFDGTLNDIDRADDQRELSNKFPQFLDAWEQHQQRKVG